MKLTVKILKLFLILAVTVSVLLFSASLFLKERVADIVLISLNKNISTKLSVGDVRLSFLKKFPKASLELRDVLVKSSTDFNRALFDATNTDTLLAAKIVSIEFSIMDIINGIYNIESIGARSGILNLLTDTAGLVNYDISSEKSKNDSSMLTIDLQKIVLNDINTTYNNLATRLFIAGRIKEGRLKSRISGEDIDFSSVAEIDIDSLQLYNASLTHPVATEIDLSLQKSADGILFKKGSLRIENYSFELSGSVTNDNNLDLKISGNNIDISKIRSYLPDNYKEAVTEYNPSGILIIECIIRGAVSRTSNPHIEVSASLNSGQISYRKSDLTLKNLSFRGFFSNGTDNLPSTSSLEIKDLKASLGSSDYKGSIKISGLDNPFVTLSLQGKVIPGEIKEFFHLSKVSRAGGSVDIDFNLKGFIPQNKKISMSGIIDMKPKAEMKFYSFDIGINENKYLFTGVNGSLSVGNLIRANDLIFNYKGQNIRLTGSFQNLPEWLTGRSVQLVASADVSFDKLLPEAFSEDATNKEGNKGLSSSELFRNDLSLDINFAVDSLSYKTYSSSDIKGALTYKSGLLTFKSLTMESLNGNISGNGFIVQNSSKSVIARANFLVADINVNRAFIVFKNFGQDFLKAENLAGSLSGEFSFLLPMDSLFKPQVNMLTAEGKYTLLNGGLINFEPIKQLSKFIELSELENIRFEKLENDFFIRNNFLYLPQMDVKSSAADLTVNGKHSFENNYEYHVKVLLSQILSTKRKKNRTNVTEFGAVEDDGLGRTSILLMVENKGEDVKVSYDIKAVGSEIKTNISTERKTLKSILNQEYGWFKGDSSTQSKPAAEKSKFKIIWDDNENQTPATDTAAVKKQGGLKNLIKKK